MYLHVESLQAFRNIYRKELNQSRSCLNQNQKPPSTYGFTLIELLIASALGGLVITAIGSIVLSQLRQNIGFEARSEMASDWARVAEYIESELFLTERAYPVQGAVTGQTIIEKAGANQTCSFSADAIKLGLALKDNSSFITYAVSETTELERAIWGAGFVLRRCGPLNTNKSDSASEQGGLSGASKSSILIGFLPNQDAFKATRGMNSIGNSTAARDISIMMALENGSIRHSGVFAGHARVTPSYNLINDEASTGSSCGSPSTTALICGSGSIEFTDANCPEYTGSAINREAVSGTQYNCDLSRVHQFKPGDGATTVNGSNKSSREDTVYFSGRRSQYEIQDGCDKNYCRVIGNGQDVTIQKGEVLVFLDQQIRI